MDEWALHALGVETGYVDVAIAEGSKLVGLLSDIAAGGPQKRQREARANRDAAIAARDAALAELETARVLAGAGGGGGVMQASAGGFGGLGGLVDKLGQPSPIGGLPWGLVVGVGVVAAWWALR